MRPPLFHYSLTSCCVIEGMSWREATKLLMGAGVNFEHETNYGQHTLVPIKAVIRGLQVLVRKEKCVVPRQM